LVVEAGLFCVGILGDLCARLVEARGVLVGGSRECTERGDLRARLGWVSVRSMTAWVQY